jgi:exosome complex exonuclease DIS3/RRP44
MQSVTIRPAHFKTRHGKILKVVRENYLRNDVEHGLGSKLCQESAENTPSNTLNCTTNACLIVVDTNVVLNQIDILESECIKNIILPQTTLREVKHRSLSIYKRVRSLITNLEKNFFVFSNEHSIDTWLEREIGETSNDYHDRLIRRVAGFYSSILLKKSQKSGQKVDSDISLSVCLISDDKDCRLKAKTESIDQSLNFFALSSEQWIQSMPPCQETDELFDKLSRAGTQNLDIDSKDIFDQYLPMSQLNLGIKSGKFIQAKLNIMAENPSVGRILPREGTPVLIQGLKALNRGVQNDVVCVQLLDKSEWRHELEEFNDLSSGDLDNTGTTRNGRVVGVVKRNWRQYCGMLDENSKNGSKIMFLPADEKIPKIEIETRQMATLMGQRIVVCIDEWPRNKANPLGHFIRALGKCGDNAAENEVILLEQDIPHEPFSKSVLACLPAKNFQIPESEIKKRVDFRHLPICSVDPPGCTDIDDTLHFVKIDENWAEVGVHIADVSYSAL